MQWQAILLVFSFSLLRFLFHPFYLPRLLLRSETRMEIEKDAKNKERGKRVKEARKRGTREEEVNELEEAREQREKREKNDMLKETGE